MANTLRLRKSEENIKENDLRILKKKQNKRKPKMIPFNKKDRL